MQSALETVTSAKKQSVAVRMLFFFLGAGVNYLLISTPFKYLTLHTTLPIFAKAALSLAISTTFFFFWNYFINFRTDSRKRDALARYLVASTCMWALQTLTLTFLKHCNIHYNFQIGKFHIDPDIIATQFLVGGFKFLLYHYWAFPADRSAGNQPPATPQT